MTTGQSFALIAAATLTVFIGVVHSWLGEVRLIGPLLDPAARAGVLERRFSRNVLRVAWHITSLAWVGLGAVLAAYAVSPPDRAAGVALILISATFALTGIIILLTGRGRHYAWPVFLAIAGLALTPLF